MSLNLHVMVHRVDNFVNDLDIVPRLLGPSFSDTYRLVCQKMGCKELAADHIKTAQGYQPFGYFHIMANGLLTSFDSLVQHKFLDYQWSSRLNMLWRFWRQGLMDTVMSLHGVSSYQSTIACVLQRPFCLCKSTGQSLQLVHKMLYGMLLPL